MISYRQADIFKQLKEKHSEKVLIIAIDEDYILKTQTRPNRGSDIGWTIPVCIPQSSSVSSELIARIDGSVLPGLYADNMISVGEVYQDEEGLWVARNYTEENARAVLPDMKRKIDEKFRQLGIEFSSSEIIWPAHAIEYRFLPGHREYVKADLFNRFKQSQTKRVQINIEITKRVVGGSDNYYFSPLGYFESSDVPEWFRQEVDKTFMSHDDYSRVRLTTRGKDPGWRGQDYDSRIAAVDNAQQILNGLKAIDGVLDEHNDLGDETFHIYMKVAEYAPVVKTADIFKHVKERHRQHKELKIVYRKDEGNVNGWSFAPVALSFNDAKTYHIPLKMIANTKGDVQRHLEDNGFVVISVEYVEHKGPRSKAYIVIAHPLLPSKRADIFKHLKERAKTVGLPVRYLLSQHPGPSPDKIQSKDDRNFYVAPSESSPTRAIPLNEVVIRDGIAYVVTTKDHTAALGCRVVLLEGRGSEKNVGRIENIVDGYIVTESKKIDIKNWAIVIDTRNMTFKLSK